MNHTAWTHTQMLQCMVETQHCTGWTQLYSTVIFVMFRMKSRKRVSFHYNRTHSSRWLKASFCLKMQCSVINCWSASSGQPANGYYPSPQIYLHCRKDSISAMGKLGSITNFSRPKLLYQHTIRIRRPLKIWIKLLILVGQNVTRHGPWVLTAKILAFSLFESLLIDAEVQWHHPILIW